MPMSWARVTARSTGDPLTAILNFPRQEREFRVVGRPLPEQLRGRAGIPDFIGGGAGKVVGRHVPDAVPGCLDGVHFHISERVEDIPEHP